MAGSDLIFAESGGLVAFDAINASRFFDGPTHAWEPFVDVDSVTGTVLVSAPNIGAGYGTPGDPDSPVFETDLHIATAGTWYLWVLADANSSAGDDSMHYREAAGAWGSSGPFLKVGISGGLKIEAAPGYVWCSDSHSGRLSLSLSAGLQKLQIAMREDGLHIDRVVLTTSSTYDPSTVNGGDGPAQSDVVVQGYTGLVSNSPGLSFHDGYTGLVRPSQGLGA